MPACIFEAPAPLHEAGKTSEDPSWRKRPTHFVSLASGLDDIAVVTPDQSPNGPSHMPQDRTQARSWFRFGVPGTKFLSFEGPGGEATAHGALLTHNARFTRYGITCCIVLQAFCEMIHLR